MRHRLFWILPALILTTGPLFGLPRFSSRTGAKCQSCHVNPTGKGMRTFFGRSYGVEDLTMPTWKESSVIEKFSTSLTPNISIGADVRTLLFYEMQSKNSSAFQMQGDIYLDLQLNNDVRIYLDKGLYAGFEIFALAKVAPSGGYVKVGKFMPAYGTRTDDHNAFIRGGPYGGGPFAAQFGPLASAGYITGLRFGERSEDTGIEVGASPGIFTFNAGVFNGTPGAGLGGVTGSRSKAYAVRGDASTKLAGVNLQIGGSYYRANAGRHEYAAVFGAVTVADRYTLNSEVDRVVVAAGGRTRTGLIFWNELNMHVVDGVDLKLGYEFYDPDIDLRNGSFTRALIGAEFFVLPGVELRPLYRFNVEEPVDVANNEVQFLFHFFF